MPKRKRDPNKLKKWRRDYYERNKRKVLDRLKEWRNKNPGKLAAQRKRRKERYPNLENERILRIKELEAGRPRPLTCELPGCGRQGRIDFEHDHKTGKFRGWLCQKCNSAIAMAEDNPGKLEELAKYLKNNGN